MVAVLSCSRFKRADYLLPAYAGAAIFVGCAVERWYLTRSATTRRRAACGFALTLALLPAWWVGFDHFVTADEAAARAQAPFAGAIRTAAPAPQPVLLFRVESHLLAYHLGRPVHTLVEWTDLDARLRPAGRTSSSSGCQTWTRSGNALTGRFEAVARSEDATRAGPTDRWSCSASTPTPWPTNPPRD